MKMHLRKLTFALLFLGLALPDSGQTACVPPLTGLIAWWRGENNALDSIGASHGTLHGTVTATAGRVGQAWQFDGAEDYVEFPDGVGNFQTNDFSIECWFKSSAAGIGHLVTKRGVLCGFGNFIDLDFAANGYLFFHIDAGSEASYAYVYSAQPLNDGVFHHAVVTRSGTDVRLFIDGSLAGSATTPGVLDINNSSPLRVGKSPCGGYNGLVDELSLYSRALNGAEVAALFAAGSEGKCVDNPCPPPSPGLIAWWRGEDNAQDTGGNNHGTLMNGVTFTPGRVGTAFNLDGIDDFVSMPDSASLTTPTAITVGAWINVVATNDVASVVSKHNGDDGPKSWGLGVMPAGALRFVVNDANQATLRYKDTATDVIRPGIATHVAATFDTASQEIKLYVNGVEQVSPIGSGSGTVNSIADTPTPVCLGTIQILSGQLFYLFHGTIDEVSIHNRALSAVEIATQAQCVPAPPQNLVVNGGFELPLVVPPDNFVYRTGTELTGWTITTLVRGAIQFKTAYRPVAEAQQAVQIESAGDALSQSFATVPGQSYRLALDLSAYDAGGGVIAVTVGPASASFTGSSSAYSHHTLDFIAVAASSTLTLVNAGINAVSYPHIDNVTVTASSCVTPPTGLAAWWRGENNAQDNVGNHNGAVQGGASFSTAKVGQGFTFDSDDDRLTIPDASALNIQAGGFTVEFWMRGLKNQPNSLTALVEKSHGYVDSTGWAVQLDSVSGFPILAIGSGNDFPIVSGTADVLDGFFHHIAGTWNGASMAIYVDGQLQGTTPLATPANNNRPLNFGSAWGGGSPLRFFHGTLDEVSLYSRALTATEVAAIHAAGSSGKCQIGPPLQISPDTTTVPTGSAINFTATGGTPPYAFSLATNNSGGSLNSSNGIYTAGNTLATDTVRVTDSANNPATATATVTVTAVVPCTPPSPGPVAWWRAESNAQDSAGLNHGTLIGGTAIPGVNGQALNFNGVNECVVLPYSLDLLPGVNSFTVEGWARTTSHAVFYNFYECAGSCNGNSAFNVQVDAATGAMAVYLRDTDAGGPVEQSQGQSVVGQRVVTDGQWHHFAAVRDLVAGRVLLYVDGTIEVDVAINAGASGNIRDDGGDLDVILLSAYDTYDGSATGLRYFYQSSLDEITVYQRALTAAEVQARYTCGGGTVPLQISPTTASVANGGTVTFTTTGGTPPYTFSLATNNSGGSINSSNSVYTAGNLPGLDAILVSDSVGGNVVANVTVGIVVAGTATPYLAGLPAGTLSSLNAPEPPDIAPQHSPVLVAGFAPQPNSALWFRVVGGVGHWSGSILDPPDGRAAGVVTHRNGAEHGISDVRAPIDSLVGVFLGADSPEVGPVPPQLNFSTPGLRDHAVLMPQLKQVFFIGDGLQANGNYQLVVPPAGATRLYLATMDGYGWGNNTGRFLVSVNSSNFIAPFAVTPAASDVALRATITFIAGGGAPPYTFTFATNASGGSLTNNGVYTAGTTPGQDTILAADALGSNATANVTVLLTHPELRLTAAGSGALTVAWDSAAAGFVLECTESLVPPVAWQEVPLTNGITDDGVVKTYSITNFSGAPAKFYRLRLP